jgi:hypothetical protein
MPFSIVAAFCISDDAFTYELRGDIGVDVFVKLVVAK